jgi:hypothetical protein
LIDAGASAIYIKAFSLRLKQAGDNDNQCHEQRDGETPQSVRLGALKEAQDDTCSVPGLAGYDGLEIQTAFAVIKTRPWRLD